MPVALLKHLLKDLFNLLLGLHKSENRSPDHFGSIIAAPQAEKGLIHIGDASLEIAENDGIDGRGNRMVLDAQFLIRLPGAGDIDEGTKSADRLAVLCAHQTGRHVRNNP
ncbi:MAG: hypothetical protein BWX99_02307 [Deltaproteobacteria bacterium ADurb.Bin151]|nr:MAG: hypothetical protein BWX99_02307 [Deltaproteobacteria bacterium ADurb.Bin151]